MTSKLFVLAAATLAVASTSQAHAQGTATARGPEQVNYFEQAMAAPKNAFELSVSTGYTQGSGMLQGGVGMPSVATPGFAVGLGAGYRIDPRWAVGVSGQYDELTAERANGARGFTTGVSATYHFSPYVRTDPWIQAGTGYRLLWETHNAPIPTLLTHGFQLAKVSAGVDIRLSNEVAIAPTIGADLNVFVWQDAGNTVAIADPRASMFFFAGVQGRFDVGATYQTESTTTAKR